MNEKNKDLTGEEIEICKNTSCLHCLNKNGICPKYGKSLVVKILSEENEVEDD